MVSFFPKDHRPYIPVGIFWRIQKRRDPTLHGFVGYGCYRTWSSGEKGHANSTLGLGRVTSEHVKYNFIAKYNFELNLITLVMASTMNILLE